MWFGKSVLLLITIASAVYYEGLMNDKHEEAESNEKVENGATGSFTNYSQSLADLYGVSLGKQFISFIYEIYLRFKFIDVVMFLLRYISTVYYMIKFVQNIYGTTSERLINQQTELEDIQLKIQIINTKLCVRDAEFMERPELLRREKKRLRRVRARVRELIAADEALRRTLEAVADCDEHLDMHVHSYTTSQEDDEFITELLKGLEGDRTALSERLSEKMDCGKHASDIDATPDHNIYSSLSDIDMKQDYRVKIVKVTNVYKVAYLKHYIKQKRLQRANKRALLKKKMENITKLMEDWQKTLNMAINRTIMNKDTHQIDMASLEAMGDYSKPRDSSSDCDLRNESFIDEYSFSWAHNPYRTSSYNYEDIPETAVSRDYYDGDVDDMKHSRTQQCEMMGQPSRKMVSIAEETGSQLAIEDISCEAADEPDSRDVVAI